MSTRMRFRAWRWRRTALCAAAMWMTIVASPALAQNSPDETVRLRAGEHSGYSRVVLDLSGIGAWTSEASGRRFVLRFADRKLQFNTTQVYPGRRVTRVLKAEGASVDSDSLLTLTLSCDCSTNVFTLGDRKLVIDVRDKAVAPPPPAEKVEAAAKREAATARTETPLLSTITAAPFTAAPLAPLPAPTAAPLPSTRPAEIADQRGELHELVAAAAPNDPTAPIEAEDAAPSLEAAAESNAMEIAGPPFEVAAATPNSVVDQAAEKNLVETPDASVEDARRHLLEQLTRAAEQGLLEFSQPDPANVEDPATDLNTATSAPAPAEGDPHGAEDTAEMSAPEFSLMGPPPPGIDVQIAARSVLDRDASQRMSRNSGDAAALCVSDRHLDAAAWAEDAPMAEQIPALRTALLGEFDEVSGEATLDLARLYIYFGFGAEAEAVLRAMEPDNANAEALQTAALLIDLSHIVEGREVTQDGPIMSAGDCDGRFGMWLLAAGRAPGLEDAAGDGAVDTASIEASLAQTPIHLRRALTPRIVGALLDRDEVEAAARVHLILARAGGDHGDAYRFAEARLAAAEGRHAAAEGGYRGLISQNSILADQALLYLADSILARGAPPPPRLVGDLEAMAFLLRGTPLGRKLRVAEVRLRAGDGALGPTMSRIQRDMARDPAAAADLRHAAQDIWSEARADEAGTAEYAKAAIQHLDLVGAGVEADPARVAVAQELNSISLPALAVAALAPPLSRHLTPARIAAANAHLAMDQPGPALAVLKDETGAEVALLRAAAYEAEGAYPKAYAALGDGDVLRAARAAVAWRGGDWSAAAALAEDPNRLAMSAYMAGRATPTNPPALDDAPVPAIPADASPREIFLAGIVPTGEPSLASARRTLELAQGARAFLSEVLKDG